MTYCTSLTSIRSSYLSYWRTLLIDWKAFSKILKLIHRNLLEKKTFISQSTDEPKSWILGRSLFSVRKESKYSNGQWIVEKNCCHLGFKQKENLKSHVLVLFAQWLRIQKVFFPLQTFSTRISSEFTTGYESAVIRMFHMMGKVSLIRQKKRVKERYDYAFWFHSNIFQIILYNFR